MLLVRFLGLVWTRFFSPHGFPGFYDSIPKRCKGVHCVDLGESFPTHIYLQNLASIQPAPAVRALTAAEAASLVEDGIDLTDNQARIFSLAFSTDILFLDTPSNLARYVEHGAGEVRYLSDAQCRTMLLDRRLDNFNPLRIIKYTTGHYEGVCWPQ